MAPNVFTIDHKYLGRKCVEMGESDLSFLFVDAKVTRSFQLATMTAPRATTKTEFKGCTSCGSVFDDQLLPAVMEKAFVSRIVLSHNSDLINSLLVHYTGADTEITPNLHGVVVQNVVEIVLSRGEFIKQIQGNTASCKLFNLTFITNKKTYGPFANTSSTDGNFVWKAPPGMGFLFFTGRVDTLQIRSLQATFAEIRQHEDTSSVLIYENVRGESSSLSRFARNMLSPPVTLSVGPNATTFHVSQDILCRLPFFRAALTGEFLEATTKAITMPEDEPETLAALIEFLYNGVYTYTYDGERGSDTPAVDLTEGQFHIAVYSVASKYDCPLLANGAVRNFCRVLRELDSVNCLRLWKTAYDNDLPLSKWGRVPDSKPPGAAELQKQLQILYADHAEEVAQVFHDYPALATDVLRVVITKVTNWD